MMQWADNLCIRGFEGTEWDLEVCLQIESKQTSEKYSTVKTSTYQSYTCPYNYGGRFFQAN